MPSDLTDGEWAVLEPLLPPRSKLGRPPFWGYQQIVEALLYLLRGGLPWRMLPDQSRPVVSRQKPVQIHRPHGNLATLGPQHPGLALSGQRPFRLVNFRKIFKQPVAAIIISIYSVYG